MLKQYELVGDALCRRCWRDLLGDVMRHIKRACTLLQVGCLLGLLLALPIGLNSGSTAFAEISSIGLPAEDTEQTEDAAGSVSDSLSSDTAQEGESSDENLDSVSEDSTEGVDLTKYATLDAGTYFLTSTLSGHRVLDVTSGSVSAGAAIQLYGRNETAAQQFVLVDLGSRQYAFKNIKSGLYLCYPNDASRFSDHPRLTQNVGYDGAWGFAWHARQVGGGYVFSPVIDDDFAIDIAGASDSNGTEIRLYQSNESVAQTFTLEKPKAAILAELAAAHASDLADGTYYIRSTKSSWQSLDVAGGSRSSGANAQIYALNATAAQTWNISHDQNGFVTLTNSGSGLVLDVSGGSAQSGTNVQQYASNGSAAQKWIAVKDGDSIKLVSALDPSICLDIAGGNTSNGTNVRTWSDNGTIAQRWTFFNLDVQREHLDALAQQNAGNIADGRYVLALGVGGAKVLDVNGGSKANGGNVQSYVSNMTAAQQWDISHDELGYLIIKNVSSGKVLDIAGGSCTLGTNIQQYSFNGSRAQRWIAVPSVPGGSFRLQSAVLPDLVLDVAGASSSNGANVQTYASNGTVAQSVRFVSAAPDVAPSDDLGLDGWFTISLSSDSSRVFDISGGSSSNGANVQTYAANGTFAQVFKFVYVNGYYRIVNAQSGKALDVDGGNVCPGTNVHQWSGDRNNANQLFSIARNDDGSYTATNKATGLVLSVANSNVYGDIPSDSASQRLAFTKLTSLLPEGFFTISSSASSSAVLDVAGGSASDGANVQLYGSNKSIAQKWKVAKVADRDNTYTVETLVSGKVLTADEDGNVCVRSFDNSDAQLWTAQIDKGGVNFVNVATGKVLDAVGGSTSNGTNIRMYDSNGTAAQSFKLSACSLVDSGTYTIAASSNRSKVLDVASGSRSNGANVQLWSSNGSGAQKWNVSVNSDGTVSIQNCRSKKYLDVLNAQGASGANVQQWQGNGSSAQRWRVDYVGGGSFAIRSALNDSLVLDVNGGALNDGANIQIYAANGSDAQGFYFAQTSYTPEAVDLAVPVYNQYSVGLPNGCESAALTNVLNYYGFGVGPCEMADRWIPRSSWDFVWCFWGDPHSYNNGNEICAPGLNRAANNFLVSRGSNLRSYDMSGTSLYDLCNYLDDGHPVIIWTTVHQGNVGNIYARQGGYFACGNSHTVVLKGYNPQTNKVMISDTIDGYTTYDRDWIAWVYQQRGAQAVVIK